MKNMSSQWWMIVIVWIILIFFIFTTISSKKKKKEEKKKRQNQVKKIIKEFMRFKLQIKHKKIEFEQVVSRNSKEYRYRDVFDVIVKLYDSKTNELFSIKAFEIEGFTKQLSKKEFETIWKVNCELNLEDTLKNIKLSKNQNLIFKMKRKTLEEKANIKKQKELIKMLAKEERLKKKQNKKRIKEFKKPKILIHDKFSGLKK